MPQRRLPLDDQQGVVGRRRPSTDVDGRRRPSTDVDALGVNGPLLTLLTLTLDVLEHLAKNFHRYIDSSVWCGQKGETAG